MVKDCSVHQHYSYVPMERHHIWPKSKGGSNDASNLTYICANGHGAVHEYIRLLEKYSNKIPWKLKLKYGYKVRRLAKRGWHA